MNDNPATLLDAHRRGDPDAAETLARRALHITLRTATGILNDRERARDIAQDAAIEVLRDAHRIRNPQTLDAWIYRIAVRHTMHMIRRHRARSSREVALETLPEYLEPRAADSPHDNATRRELAAALHGAMRIAALWEPG